ncbi:MAG: hypothetical protein ACXAC2_20360 [Candidatus Kariarchaeaceae archaeon]|jgi:hypothetical protein
MSGRAILVEQKDWSWINKKKVDIDEIRKKRGNSDKTTNGHVVDFLVRFYEKHKGVDPDFR